MASDKLVKYIAVRTDGLTQLETCGDTKKELQENMKSVFEQGDKVLVYRQRGKGVGESKYIRVGCSWTLPHTGDDDFQKELDKQAKEYFKTEV